MNRTDHAREVRQSLNNPADLCAKLGWLDGFKRQSRGILIRCPIHGEKNPSFSVTIAESGMIRAKCFGCQWGGDALSMVAFAHRLDLRDNFQEILAIGAELAGNLGLADEIRRVQPDERMSIARPRLAPPALSVAPEPTYPSDDELGRLWASCEDPSSDAATVKMLHSRSIDFVAVSELRLARVITSRSLLPDWARYRGRSWLETGHRLLLPAYDHRGTMRSVRAWRVIDGDSPKRLPPGGCKASGLVQANREAVAMLRGWYVPNMLWVCEGEPDHFTAATTFGRRDAVIGIGSGSWTIEHAKRVHPRTRVYVATHPDEAGDRYADHVIETLGESRLTWRVRLAS